MKDCILLRYGEIGLKSKRTRPHFEAAYIRSIKDALRRNYFDDFTIDNLGGRFVVYTKPEAVGVLKRVAGIQSLSPAKQFFFKTEKDILKNVKKLGETLVKGKTFAVKVKRIGKHDFDSLNLAKEAGSVVYDKSKGVDLTTPEVTIYLEIRKNECFFYTEKTKGIGGLPLNKHDKVLCLFSGGIDSPVAAVQLMKRGCAVDFLFVNLVGEKALRDVTKIYNFIINKYAFGYTPRFFVIDGNNLVKKIKKEVPDTYRQIALKIALYKLGEELVKQNNYVYMAAGESLSQKSSQTLKSLRFIESQVEVSMLRPLLTMDKIEITKIATKLGTMAMSERIKEICNLSEGPVTTAPREKNLEHIPSFEKEIEKAIKNITVTNGIIKLENIKPVKLGKKITTVDIREKILQENNPLKTDISIPYSEVFERINEFKKTNSYLFICEFGVKSEDIAYELGKKSIKAVGVSKEQFLKYFN